MDGAAKKNNTRSKNKKKTARRTMMTMNDTKLCEGESYARQNNQNANAKAIATTTTAQYNDQVNQEGNSCISFENNEK